MVEPLQTKFRRAWRASWPFAATIAVIALAMWKLLIPRGSEDGRRPAVADADSYRSQNSNAAFERSDVTLQPESQNPDVAFEPSDWALRPVALVYVGTVVLLVISSLVLIVAYPNSLRDVGRAVRIAPPGPRLQTDAEGDLRRFRTEEEKRLNSYYWINKSEGIVHIPIEQAMRELATAGISGFPKGQQ
jgi:hypothetical protein